MTGRRVLLVRRPTTAKNDKQKILLVGRPTTAFSNFMKRALMILIFLRTFVSDKQKILLVGRPTTAKNISSFYLAAFLKPEFTMTIFTCFVCASSVVEPAY